jgi:hypothetical protein
MGGENRRRFPSFFIICLSWKAGARSRKNRLLNEKWVTGNQRLATFDTRIMSQNTRHNSDMPGVAFKRQPASHLPTNVPAHEFESLLWQSIPALGVNAEFASGTVRLP